MKILRIILRLILFVLLLVLAINNMQTVEVNFFNLYSLKLPLIVTLAIFSLLGLLVGMLMGFFNNLGLKSQIAKLRKQLEQTTTPTSESNQTS